MRVIGIISDTHGLLRPEAMDALRGAELILHAGDIGGPEVIAKLQWLAPVTAVRGNCDRGAWAEAYPLQQKVSMGEVTILILHDLNELPASTPLDGVQVVISGHSHAASILEKDGVLYLNPGGAGPKRFELPVTVALLKLDATEVSAEIIQLA